MSLLVHNGKIWRSGLQGNKNERQFYDWILIDEQSGKIRGCGGRERPQPEAQTRIDLGGKWVLPGFHDSHIHILWHGNLLTDRVNLRCPNSMKELKEKLKVMVADPYNAPEDSNDWFVGAGFEQGPLGGYPTTEDLDEICPNRPMMIYHQSLHVGVLNSAALKRVGYDENPKPENDKIGVYPSGHRLEGRPNGLLKESELAKANAKIPASNKQKKKAILSALNDCVRLGITSIHCLDAGCWDVYVGLAKEGKLPIQCFFSTFHEDFVAENRPKSAGESPGPFLKCRCVKIFADGALGSDTAALSLPYKKKQPDEKDNFGILFYTQEKLNKMVKEVDEQGFQLEIHVIGDKAAEFAVNALENCGITPEKRPILVHCQILTHDLVKRMAKLGVVAAVQPQNVPMDARWVRQKLPEPLQQCMYPYRTLIENGVICAGSSDSPAYFPNSLIGIHDVIMQPDCPQGQGSKLDDDRCFQPKERVTFTQAIDMYTSEAAKTDFAEEFLGRLEVGYFANFVVLDTPRKDGEFVDISQNPKTLLDTKVSQTWARGQKIYDVMISEQ